MCLRYVSGANAWCLPASVRGDVPLADDAGPFLVFRGDELGQFLAAARGGGLAVLQQVVAHVGRIQHFHEFGVPAVQQRLGRLAGRHEGVPVGGVEAGIRLGDGGHVGQVGRAGQAGGRQGDQLAGFQVGQGRGRCRVERGHAVAQHVLQGRRAALVGHVHGVDLRDVVEQFTRQVGGRARAGGCEIQLARLALGAGHEFAQGLDAGAGRHDQHVGEGHAHGDGGEVLERVVADLHEVGRDAQRPDGAEQQHGAVGRALGDLGMGEVAAGARLVVHDHGLADVLAELLGDHARGDVGRAAGREADHQRHRLLRGEILGARGGGDEGKTGGQCGGHGHGASLHVVSWFLSIATRPGKIAMLGSR